MNSIDPRAQATLDAAISHIRGAAASAATRVLEHLSVLGQTALKISERDQIMVTQQELRRNIGTFQGVFYEALREKVGKAMVPREPNKRKLDDSDWLNMSLVEDKEVEERMNFTRLGQMISHESEWQLRDLAAYMAALLNQRQADEMANPLRADIVGAALHRGIEAISVDADSRRLLARELGQMMAQAMPQCYTEILRMMQERGVRPVVLTVRTVEGPGNQLGSANSGYQSLRDGRSSTRSAHGDLDEHSGSGSDMDLLAAHRRALATAFPHRNPGSDPARAGNGNGNGNGNGDGSRGAEAGRGGTPGSADDVPRARMNAAADQQLMTLLRRLTSVASRHGELDPMRMLGGGPGGAGGGQPRGTGSARMPAHREDDPSFDSGRGSVNEAAGLGNRPPADSSRGGSSGGETGYSDGLTGMMAVNLIRAHREELMQASNGKLDHMVIDVVGSLFDQILSDSRVPPQMAREIARLQLPVLRVALNDSTFFSTRRHPVRRFVNRIGSLACAFDEFEDGPGAEFLARVRKLVDEIVEGDFDQVDLYAAKVSELESFIARQAGGQVEENGAVTTLEGKESELRIQQRYMLQLRAALGTLNLPPYLNDFLSQVWSQALVLASRRDGPDSDRSKRYRRVGTDLVMSVQPKGSPAFRKKFLMQLPPLMKDLNEGMKLLGWPEPAQKEFFGKLLPAHAESLKGQPLSELDHNLLVKQLEAVFALAVPGGETFGRVDSAASNAPEAIERRFTPEEARQVGLVGEAAVNWSEKVEPVAGSADIDLPIAEDEERLRSAPETGDIALESSGPPPLGPTTSQSGDPGEPISGPALIEHIKLGFAYQMHLKDEWQKVRLAHVSSGRSFFVFTRGGKHQETISMTSRMLARMCETGRFRAVESAYLMERATQRARRQLADLKANATAVKH